MYFYFFTPSSWRCIGKRSRFSRMTKAYLHVTDSVNDLDRGLQGRYSDKCVPHMEDVNFKSDKFLFERVNRVMPFSCVGILWCLLLPCAHAEEIGPRYVHVRCAVVFPSELIVPNVHLDKYELRLLSSFKGYFHAIKAAS